MPLEVKAPKISWQQVHEGDKVVRPTHRPPLPQQIPLILIPTRGWFDPRALVSSEGFSQWKLLITRSGIELATFQLVAQCLNRIRHRVPELVVALILCLRLKTLLARSNKFQHVHCPFRYFLWFSGRGGNVWNNVINKQKKNIEAMDKELFQIIKHTKWRHSISSLLYNRKLKKP